MKSAIVNLALSNGTWPNDKYLFFFFGGPLDISSGAFLGFFIKIPGLYIFFSRKPIVRFWAKYHVRGGKMYRHNEAKTEVKSG